MSLVVDYSDTSSSSSASDDSENEKKVEEQKAKSTLKKQLLPSASSLLTNSSAGEVFQTKYHKEEEAKKASLERHVKMVENDDHLTTKNGRKICWNFRKGRCRFGTKCQYAHDSDLIDNGEKDTQSAKPAAQQAPNTTQQEDNASKKGETNSSLKRKKPGLGDSITPGKRVMKAYKQQK